MRTGVVWLGLATVACGDELLYAPPPPFGADARAAVVVVRAEGDFVWAFEDVAGVAPFAAEVAPGARVHALAYRQSLAALGLTAGPVPTVAAGRPIPTAAQILRADFEAARWVDEMDPEALAGVSIAPFSAAPCLEQGGCVGFESDGTVCLLPCPPATTAERPSLPEPPCPAGWIEDPRPGLLGLRLCRPPALPPLAACPPKEIQRYGEAGCDPVGPACPGGDWPDPPAGRAPIYLRGGASGGDGSLAAPVGTWAEALALAGPTRAVLVARGSSIDEALISQRDDLWIRGACAQEVELRAPISVSGGRLVLEGVAVVDATITLDHVRARLAGVRLEGAVDPSLLVYGSTLSVDDLLVRGAITGLRARASSVTLARASVVGVGASGVSIDQSRVSLRDLVVRAPVGQANDVALDLAGCTTEAERVYTEAGLDMPGLRIIGGQARLREVHAMGSTLAAALVTQDAEVDLERGAFRGSVRGTRGRFEARDLAIHDAIDDAHGTSLHFNDRARVVIQRVLSERPRYRHINLGSSVEAVIQDVVAVGEPHQDAAEELVRSVATARFDRLLVADAPTRAIHLDPGSAVEAFDLTVLGSGQEIVLDGESAHRLTRILVEGAGAGIKLFQGRLCGETPCEFAVRDLTVRHAAGDALILDLQVGTVERILLEDVGRGVVVQGGRGARVRDGVIRGAGTAVAHPIDFESPTLLLDHVRVEDTARLFEAYAE